MCAQQLDQVAILGHVRTVIAENDKLRLFETREQIAVALVLDRWDWLLPSHSEGYRINGGVSLLEAVELLGPDGVREARLAQMALYREIQAVGFQLGAGL